MKQNASPGFMYRYMMINVISVDAIVYVAQVAKGSV